MLRLVKPLDKKAKSVGILRERYIAIKAHHIRMMVTGMWLNFPNCK